MAHAQKPNFVFQRNGRVHLNRRGASVQSTTGSRGVRFSGNNAGYTMFRDSVKGTDYPLHSPVSPSLPLPPPPSPCAITFQLDSTVNYVVAALSHIIYTYVSLYIMREHLDAPYLIYKYTFLNIYDSHWQYASDVRGN